jgi:hypothetical protein
VRRAFIAAVLLTILPSSALAEPSGLWPFQYPGADIVEADPRGESPLSPSLKAGAKRLRRSCDPGASETAMWILSPGSAGAENTIRSAAKAGFNKTSQPVSNGATITLLSRRNETLLLAAQVRELPNPAVQARGKAPEKALLVSVCRLR